MGKVVKAVVAIGVTAVGLLTGNAYLATLGAQMLMSSVSKLLTGKKAVRPEVSVEYSGTVEPRRIIYGELKVSGMHCIPPVTSGSNNKMLHQILALAGHQCNSVGATYFNQDAVGTIAAISGASGDGLVSTGAYANRAWVRRYAGTSSQTADYILDNALSIWTSSHRGRGIAYVAVQFQYDEEVYKAGKPEVSCLVQGKLCYDPRLDSSPGNDPTNASYIAYTNNPALCLADYLIDTNLGVGESASRIDWDLVVDAADICDELVAVPTASTQKRYTCNIALLATTPFEENIAALVGCMLGTCLYSGGKWRIKAGAWESASFQINDANVIGQMDIMTAYPYKERFNGVRGTFIDPNNNYQPTEFPPVSSATYVTADGESVYKDVQFPGCTNVYEAQRNAMMLVRKSRNRQATTAGLDMSLWHSRPGETGIATITEMGWSAKTARCESWRFSAEGQVLHGLREELSSDWDDPVEGDYLTPTAISNPTPVYFTPDAPSGLAAVNTPRGPQLSWTAPALMPVGAEYEVWEYTSSTPFASASRVWKGRATSALIEQTDYTTRYYWVRVVMADGTVGPEHPTSAAGVSGAAILIVRDDIDPDEVTSTTYDDLATDTFTAGLWSSTADPESGGVTATGQEGQSIEVTVTAQVEVTVYAAAQDLNCRFFWHSSLNKMSGSQDNFYPITRAGKFTITVSATFQSSSGTDGSVGAIANVFDAPASVGNTIVVTEHHMRVTSVRR